MTLSNEQEQAVNAGYGENIIIKPLTQDLIDAADRVTIPDEILDISVNWSPGFANDPSWDILVAPDADLKAETKFTYDGRRYTGKSRLGVYTIHYHGPLHWDEPLGKWVTKKDEGYGGRHFPITMEDGREAVLRGPWHGTAPEGLTEAHVFYAEEEFAKARPYQKPWQQNMGFFGFYFDTPFIIALAHRAGYEVKLVQKRGHTRLVPCMPNGQLKLSHHDLEKGGF